MSDPQYWDGERWLQWDGTQWAPHPDPPPPPEEPHVEQAVPEPGSTDWPPPTAAPPRKSHTGAIIATVAGALAFVLILAVGAFWLISRSDDNTTTGTQGTSITTVPINGTQDSFTDPVGTDQQITPKTTKQPVTVPGGEPGLYGGTRDIGSCNRQKLIRFLMANPDKGRAWAGVLGIDYEQLPTFVMKLTPLVLRSDTLVMNHGYADGQATSFLSVLQAGTAVLVGRRGLPVVRCYCGNPLTQPPAQVTDAVYTGPTWPGWNPQSITVITQNVTVIDIFIVIDIVTGDRFTRPAGTAGGADGTTGTDKSTTAPPESDGSTSAQVEDVTGFLSALAAGDYAAADSYCTGGFISRFGGAANIAPGWGRLTSWQITGSHSGDTFVAVYVNEVWEGGTRSSTYYVTKTGGTYIEDADFVDTDTGYTEDPYTEDPYTEDPYTEDPYTEDPYDYPSDYPEQYPDEGGEPTDAVG